MFYPRKVIFLSFPHSFSVVFHKSPLSSLELPFGKHPFCYYPVYFPLEIEVMCKQFIVEDVVEGETVSSAKIIYPRFDRLSPTAIPWLQRSVLEIQWNSVNATTVGP